MKIGSYAVIFWLIIFIGWVLNIIALIHMGGQVITTTFVLRCIGIFAFPFGAIMGYFV